jgi:hypothetical protein
MLFKRLRAPAVAGDSILGKADLELTVDNLDVGLVVTNL